MVGLAIDLGRMFVVKSELQNVVDACALAASKELDGNAGAIVRSDAAGILVGERNRINFQDVDASIDELNITYSESLDGTYSRSVSDADAKYVKCTLSRPNNVMMFMGVLGFGSQTVAAHAVASLVPSQSPCVIPIGFCKGFPATGETCWGGVSNPDSNGLCVGAWSSGRFRSGSGDSTSIYGAFNWLDLPNDAGHGVPVLQDQIVNGYCGPLTGETVEAETGNLGEAAAKAWNTRFGLYHNGGGYAWDGTPPAAADQTGYSYTTTPEGQVAWPLQRSAYADFVSHRPGRVPYQGNTLTGLTLSNAYTPVQEALDSGTIDRRIVTVPVVDCSGWTSGHVTTYSPTFACVLMLHPIASPTDIVYMEYLGVAGVAGSPCPAFGLPGGGGGGTADVPGLVQ